MDNKIYLQLKKHISIRSGQTVFLHDVADLLCPVDIKKKIKKLVIPIDNSRDNITTTINVIEIIEIINKILPQAVVISVGEKQVSIIINKEESKKIDFINLIKLAITCFLLFVGSGLAIMYFHADVNMHQVHETLIIAITGESTSPYWINIPYSIGIGLGIALFFGIFPMKNKNPDPLEIEIFKYEKDVNSYLENSNEKSD
jgi:stage V sporulation protein AA